VLSLIAGDPLGSISHTIPAACEDIGSASQIKRLIQPADAFIQPA
jgi:hypothetical protein